MLDRLWLKALVDVISKRRNVVGGVLYAGLVVLLLFLFSSRQDAWAASVEFSAAALLALLTLIWLWFDRWCQLVAATTRIRLQSMALIISGILIVILGIGVIALGVQLRGAGPTNDVAKASKPLTAAERHAAERAAFLEQRGQLEESLQNIDGKTIVLDFPESGISKLEVGENGAIDSIHVSKHSGTGIWIYDRGDDVIGLYKIGKAARGEILDLSMFGRPTETAALEIGETAVLQTADAKHIQIIVVQVRYKGAGDEKDSVSVRYRIHPAEEHPIKAL